MTEPRCEISVWNIVEGDLVEKLWEATEAELSDIEERYRDAAIWALRARSAIKIRGQMGTSALHRRAPAPTLHG